MLVLALFCSLAAVADAANFLGSGQVKKGDVSRFLESELAGKLDSGRLAKIEDSLRTTYTSLPKNSEGNLGHQAVRYVLHRYFVQRYGWFIRGLEPNNDTWADLKEPSLLKEWVPNYLQGLLEQRLGERGSNLHELAALAAALEDLIDMEAKGRLETAFQIHGLPRNSIGMDQVMEVVTTYYVMFLRAGNFSAFGREDAIDRVSAFTSMYTGWDEAKKWMEDTLRPRMTGPGAASFDFEATASMVEDIGEKYYKFNDLECRDLKVTMRQIEGNKAGRVRLSQFYKKALYSHWQFTEKADYLRSLGALDETDPKSPQVLVPNYIMARPNCLEASNLYAICCRNECEDLMGNLEATIGTSMADPAQIVKLVSALPSDTVTAPRNLAGSLLARLDQVAAGHGGKVPLHGRLFAQWMHHAYPRECPYPHQVGTTSPQTPDEWMAQTGQGASQATQEEMEKTVEADACVSTDGSLPQPGKCGGSELPWSENEELLVAHPHEQPASQARSAGPPTTASSSSSSSSACLRDIVIACSLLLVLAVDFVRNGGRRGNVKLKDEDADKCCAKKVNGIGWRAIATFSAVAFVAHAFNLLDTVLLGCTLFGGSCVVLARHLSDRRAEAPPACEPFYKDCV